MWFVVVVASVVGVAVALAVVATHVDVAAAAMLLLLPRFLWHRYFKFVVGITVAVCAIVWLGLELYSSSITNVCGHCIFVSR